MSLEMKNKLNGVAVGKLVILLALFISSASNAGFISFDTSGTFIVPTGVNSVRVLAIGGVVPVRGHTGSEAGADT